MSRRGTRFLRPEELDRIELELICRGCRDRGRREVLDIWTVRLADGDTAHTSGRPRCEEQLVDGRWRYVYRCDKHTPARSVPFRADTLENALKHMRNNGMSKSVVPI